MPKLPRGLIRRGRIYHARLFEGGRELWRSLRTADYGEACQRLKQLRSGEAEVIEEATVSAVGDRWVEGYVAAARSPKNKKMTEARLSRYLSRHLGHKLVGKVTADDLRHFRLWLERKGINPLTVKQILSDCRCLFRWC